MLLMLSFRKWPLHFRVSLNTEVVLLKSRLLIDSDSHTRPDRKIDFIIFKNLDDAESSAKTGTLR